MALRAEIANLPKNGTPEEITASSLSNGQLAKRIVDIRYNRRAFPKAQADAYLFEAYKRLTWPDNYEKHRE